MQPEGNARDVVATMFLSLDGVMETPENWHKEFHNAEVQAFKHEELFDSDALLLGRRTYEIFAGAWPSRSDAAGFAHRMNSIRKYVVSRALTQPEWNNTLILEGDVPTQVRGLKSQPGNPLLICGSGELVRTLMQHGLIDELRLLIDPIVLGSGTRLFPADGVQQPLSLVGCRRFDTGSVLLTYRAPSGAE